VDLAASDRAARRLVFRPVADAPIASPVPTVPPVPSGAIRSELHVMFRADGSHDFTRHQVGADGLRSELKASGRDAASLLAAMAAVPLERHHAAGPGWALARNFTLADIGPGGRASLRFVHGQARLDGLTFTLKVPGTAIRSAELAIVQIDDRPRPALPEDLLAVLGWPWARLLAERAGWKSRIRLPRGRQRRHEAAEAAFDLATAHLARTLHDGPAQWHPRHRRARWGVFLRRGIPSITFVLLLGIVLTATQLDIHVDRAPGLWVAMYHVPTLLIALSFMLQELPRFEIPPLPRPLVALRWWGEGGAGGAVSVVRSGGAAEASTRTEGAARATGAHSPPG
jgi:hypothetical protein